MPSGPPTLAPSPPPPAAVPGTTVRTREALAALKPRARAFILLVWGAGLLAAAWAVFQVLWQPPPMLAAMAVLIAVALAAHYPVHLPRSHYAVSAADALVFLALLSFGPAVATLAALIEGMVGARVITHNPFARISTLLVTTLAMGLAAGSFVWLQPLLTAWGLSPAVAELLALPLVVPVYQLMASTPSAVLRALDGRPANWGQWLTATTLGGSVMLATALVVTLLHLNTQQFGPAVLAVVGGATAALLLLMRFSMQRLEAQQQARDAQLQAARRAAELNQQRFAVAFTHAAIGMVMVRPDGTVMQVNQALKALLGEPEALLLSLPFSHWLHPADAEAFAARADAVAAGRDGEFAMELRCCRGDGRTLWVSLHGSACEDPGGAGSCLIFQLLDISTRREAEGRLHYIAHHDTLTDLANRHGFLERLKVAVERHRADPEARFAVLFLDLDRFKAVNDSLGHSAGNLMLREVAQRLRSVVRPTDTVARLGGDEFALLLESLSDPADVAHLVDRLLQSLSGPLALGGKQVVPLASVGVTLSDHGAREADAVLRDADLAMYEAKRSGRGHAVTFERSMFERSTERLALEADLRQAVAAGDLHLHYQPVYALQPQRLDGFEALARWDHAQRGAVSPTLFIPLAEEIGLMPALTSHVLDQALGQLAAWRRQGAPALRMSVNISGQDLARADLADEVQALLQRHAVPADALTLEITETALMSRLDTALATFERLRALGVCFSIDDFGTGYSSLTYLGRLPFDTLKIDRSFVTDLPDKPESLEIVRAVRTLAASLGRRVVAEGIETDAQLDLLRRMGVDYGQGYLFARPLSAADAAALWLPAPAAVGGG